MPERILVIDDEDSMCNFMEIMLSKEGYAVATTTSGVDGVSKLREGDFDLVIADLNMPEISGLEVLQQIKSFKNEQEIIVMTAFASVDTAIEAMKLGAADYITKPFKVDEIKLAIEKSISRKVLIDENRQLKKQLGRIGSFDDFIGNSDAVIELKRVAARIADSDSTILIRGESGTGKDVMARAIHNHSARCSGPFVSINCAALPETLLESELFGHKKGSFTGAVKDKDGLFKEACGGTFFLDEIGDTSPAIQVKLLKALEEKRITPVGSTKPIDVDVRLLAATNADLEQEVKAGRFRADLFYRLNVIPLYITPLRERREDIPILVEHFAERLRQKAGGAAKKISAAAMEILTNYNWPGNVRELENTIERAFLLNRSGTIEPTDFPEKLTTQQQPRPVGEHQPETPTLESIEKAYIHYIMTQTDGKKAEAARLLGINTSTLYRKLDRYRLGEKAGDEKEEGANKKND